MFSRKYSDGGRSTSAVSHARWRLNAWSIRYMKCGAQPASASTHTTCRSGWRSNTAPSTSIADDVLAAADDRRGSSPSSARGAGELIGAAGEDVERRHHLQVDARRPELVVDRRVVVLDLQGCPASSRRASPCAFISSRSRMPSSGERIAVWPEREQAVRVDRSSTRRSTGCTPASTRACSRSRGGCTAPSRPTGRSARR